MIYGRGREAETMADFLFNEVQVKPGVIYYFGDLDRLGITIPYRLSRMLERRGGRGINPAAECYRLLLQQSPTTIANVDVDMNDESDDPPDSEWAVALDWLPEDVRTQATALLAADRRIAQEATGWELLRNIASLI